MLTTPLNGLPYPQLGDAPNAPVQLGNIASALDTVLVPRFATTGARDAAITAPIAGQLCFLNISATDQRLQIYRSGAWGYLNFPSYALATSDVNYTTTTATAHAQLNFPVVAGAVYKFTLDLKYMAATDIPDLRITQTYPATTTGVTHVLGIDPAATTTSGNGNITSTNALAGTSVAVAIFGTVAGQDHSALIRGIILPTVTGTVGFSFAQNTASATQVTVYAGSNLKYARI